MKPGGDGFHRVPGDFAAHLTNGTHRVLGGSVTILLYAGGAQALKTEPVDGTLPCEKLFNRQGVTAACVL